MKGSLSLQSLGSCEGTDPMQVPPSLLTVWPRKCAFIVEEILQTENAYVMSLTETVKVQEAALCLCVCGCAVVWFEAHLNMFGNSCHNTEVFTLEICHRRSVFTK